MWVWSNGKNQGPHKKNQNYEVLEKLEDALIRSSTSAKNACSPFSPKSMS